MTEARARVHEYFKYFKVLFDMQISNSQLESDAFFLGLGVALD